MMQLKHVAAVAGMLAVGAAAPLHADQFRTWNVCGGNAFNTCASVQVTVTDAGHVTMRVWNLSGNGNGSYANTVFTGIGFENVGTASAVASSLTMTGPARGSDTPSTWQVTNDKQIGGGVNLDMVTTANSSGSVDNSIASGCADPSLLPGGSNQLWMNPCSTPGASDAGWVIIQFDITGTWNLGQSYMLVKGQNGPNGASTECITGGTGANCGVVPEPITLALLGTGLFGIGGVALRRRKGNDILSG